MNIKDRIEAVQENIQRSAQKCGRDFGEITLVAVSKTHPAEEVLPAVQFGLMNLGENRVQEMTSKMELLPENIQWHLIGQLQKNKVKYIINKVALVHSLCTLSVANEIQRLCEKNETAMDCLLELNIAKEESKSGLFIENLDAFLDEIQPLDRIHIRGLMTVAPQTDDPEKVRPVFAEMRRTFDKLTARENKNFRMDILSMGMSGDYGVAIEEGATTVRIGSAIFGERNYNRGV